MIRLGIDPGMDGHLVALRGDLSVAPSMQMPTIDVQVTRQTRNWAAKAKKAEEEGKRPPPKSRTGKKRIYDLAELNRVLLELLELDQDLFVALEVVQVRSKESAAGALAAGRGFGGLEGLLVAHRIPHEIVPAIRWQKHVLKGIEGADTKARAILRTQRALPALELPRAKKRKEAAGDAACIALYGLHLRPSPTTQGQQIGLSIPSKTATERRR